MDYRKAIVCGDRFFQDEKMIRYVLCHMKQENGLKTIVHGGARGADELAEKVAKEIDLDRIEYSAQWSQHGKAGGPIRNGYMLKSNPDIVLAFHDDLKKSKGTKHMCTIALLAQKRVVQFFHVDGGWNLRDLDLEDLK